MFGVFFGFLMPVVAILVIRFVSDDVYILFVLVCTAPFFWGPVGWFAGVFQDRLADANRGLEALVQERTSAIQSLLDSSGEGFLSFGKDLLVNPEHSKTCERIFGGPIAGRRIDALLYQDADQGADFAEGVALCFDGKAQPAVVFDVLDHELTIRGRTIRVDYRTLSAARIMIILTDITEERQLQSQIQGENDRRDLLYRVMTHREHFGSFTREARRTIGELSGPIDDLQQVIRDVHTFKGNAGLFGFRRSQEAAHEVEDYLQDAAALGEAIALNGKLDRLQLQFREEISVVTGTLGHDWIRDAEAVVVPKEDYLKIEHHVSRNHPGDLTLIQALEHFRERPILSLFSRFPQMVEDLAHRRGKRVAPLKLSGGGTRIVPEEWQELVSAFGHIIRNMVDHGIEPPAEREAAGKPAVGHIKIDISESKGALTFLFEDDGRGIELAKLEAEARTRGIIGPGEKPQTRRLLELIFRDGVSTASTVTMVSGRGVGLAAVRETVQECGGRIRVGTRVGRGSTFSITVPLKHPWREKT